MSKVFCIDISKCSGCYNCQLACKDEHCGNDWTPIAKPQPEIGQFWIKVNEYVCGTTPKVRMHYVPTLCNHCEKAACLDVCPDNAIYRDDNGLIIIDPVKCTGCKKCQEACPYCAIYWNDELNVAQKCTGCKHLLDNGYKLPRCVEACPMDAMTYGDEDDEAIKDLTEGAVVMQPEYGLYPKVYYRNIPGKFIAGTVYDPVSKEVVIGAKVRINNGYKTWRAVTNGYGDFWFNDLAIGLYDLVIEAEGYEIKAFENIRTRESVNMGDIALTGL